MTFVIELNEALSIALEVQKCMLTCHNQASSELESKIRELQGRADKAEKKSVDALKECDSVLN